MSRPRRLSRSARALLGIAALYGLCLQLVLAGLVPTPPVPHEPGIICAPAGQGGGPERPASPDAACCLAACLAGAVAAPPPRASLQATIRFAAAADYGSARPAHVEGSGRMRAFQPRGPPIG